MKLAFSTITCPKWSFDEIVSTAADLNFDGVEIRGVSNELYAPAIKNFSDSEINNTLGHLKKSGVAVSCLASGACLADASGEKALAEGKAYIDLAHKLNVKFVRVMPTGVPHLDGGDKKQCKQLYRELCVYGEGKNVTPLMETNGMFADTSVLAEFIQGIDSPNKGVLWDIHHPYRFNGESISKTISNIGKYVKYVHVKDSLKINSETVYKLLGHGDVPVKAAVEALEDLGYNGYLSLEWVKRWNKNLEEPYIAIPNFVSYMRLLLDEA